MEIHSVLLAICAGNSTVTGEFSAQRPVTRSFDVFIDLRLKKRLSKRWWIWRRNPAHYDVIVMHNFMRYDARIIHMILIFLCMVVAM